ncbi:hypothetical protein GQ44DRAFT_741803 [Phaeosphaeriaceae sp. PMI808]|nr:hypothetical protein GQ44DRAFT_741803 [Phaeosphaeriaceae sp. PMI808]
MKFNIGITILALGHLSSAHSWAYCTSHDNSQILEWMKGNATEYGKDRVVDPLMPWFAHFCKGWPRSKQNPGDWIEETNTYLWDIQDAVFNKKDTHACHPNQRSPTYHLTGATPSLKNHQNPAPMATAKAGSSIKLMFGGNGHSRGANAGGNGDAGRVGVYWAGKPETEIVDIKELTKDNLIQENGFSEESFSFPEDLKVQSPSQGLIDKGNWMTLEL